MILKRGQDEFPAVKNRCPLRFLLPKEEWEKPGRFKTPVLFLTGIVQINEEPLVSYRAADGRVGSATITMEVLLQLVRRFDSEGRRIHQ